jgi:hypothetical protein
MQDCVSSDRRIGLSSGSGPNNPAPNATPKRADFDRYDTHSALELLFRRDRIAQMRILVNN